MTVEAEVLIVTAATIGFFHTLLGPDHYVPFIMLSWSRKWSTLKTAIITFACGIGHIGSSVVLGFIGIMLGVAVSKLQAAESIRGSIAAWILIAFGLVYFVWGLRQGYRNKPHKHVHLHHEGDEHEHSHGHFEEHVHIHGEKKSDMFTFWTLFIIFIFGPCEPLIPLLIYPAAAKSVFTLTAVTVVFSTVTIGTMMTVVLLSRAGVKMIRFPLMERYIHAIGGGTILLCGLAIVFLGL